jgi:hypothetical protein
MVQAHRPDIDHKIAHQPFDNGPAQAVVRGRLQLAIKAIFGPVAAILSINSNDLGLWRTGWDSNPR